MMVGLFYQTTATHMCGVIINVPGYEPCKQCDGGICAAIQSVLRENGMVRLEIQTCIKCGRYTLAATALDNRVTRTRLKEILNDEADELLFGPL
jgi:hypothetical protein